jgi:hypothetical protein
MQAISKLFKPSGKKTGNKKRSNKANKGGMQRQKAGHVYTTNPGPVFAPSMPKEFSVALVDRQVIQINAIPAGSATGYQNIYGLIEFLNKRPLYSTEFYALYKFCRVTAVNYHFEVVNTGAVPIEIMFAICPYVDAAAPVTLAQLGEKPGVVRHIISPVGGMDRRSLTKTCKAEDWFGNPYFTRDYWVNQAQSVAVTPLDVEEPVGVFATANLSLTLAASCTIVSKTTYHIQFFDLELNQAPTNTILVNMADDIDSDSEDLVPVKKPVSNKTTTGKLVK